MQVRAKFQRVERQQALLDSLGEVGALVLLLTESVLKSFQVELLRVHERGLTLVQVKLIWKHILLTVSL